jgi:hypothetical protein
MLLLLEFQIRNSHLLFINRATALQVKSRIPKEVQSLSNSTNQKYIYLMTRLQKMSHQKLEIKRILLIGK